MKKRIFSIAMAIVLALGFLPVTDRAGVYADETYSGSLNGTATYEYADGVLTIHGGTIGGEVYGPIERWYWPWRDDSQCSSIRSNVTKVVFDDDVVASGNLSSMFSGFTNLIEIEGLKKMDTAGVTSMSGMFYGCSALESLDLSNFNTSNTTDMSAMFVAMKSLKAIDLGKFDTSKVTKMDNMFSGMESLTELDVSNFNTSSVTSMSFMFSGCSNLTDLNLSNFDTSKVTSMGGMFYECSSLKGLDLSSFNTSLVTDTGNMFYFCSALTSLNLSSFNTERVTNMIAMFVGCSSLEVLDISNFYTPVLVRMDNMFDRCSSLKELSIAKLSTSNVEKMEAVFRGCSSLVSLDLSGFDTAKVTSMVDMFEGCSSLKSLDLRSFNTSSVTDMHSMFFKCSALEELNVSTFDTSNVKYIQYMFNGCESLKRLDVSGFDTSNVEDMAFMFSNCRLLTTLDVSHFNTAKVRNIRGLFHSCYNLTSLDLTSFDMSNLDDDSNGTQFFGSNNRCLSRVTMGPNFRIRATQGSDTQLPIPYSYAESQYTGNWVRVDDESKKEYSASYIKEHYPSTELPPGTYVWAEKPKHTAVFKVGETVVAEVPFIEGSSTLEEPAVPEKDNYIGKWAEYDLSAATDDIEISAHYDPLDPNKEVSELSAEADATYSNSVVTINLSASAPSKTIKVLSETTKPLDVVLVLDQSGSMADTLGGSQTKRDALVSCAEDFAEELFKSAKATGADHRIALSGFAYSSYNGGRYKNTGLLATQNGGAVNYGSLADSDYKAALLPINVDGKINEKVVSGINSIAAEGATAADLGLRMAKNIFTENPAGSDRERVVIFITDGTPTSWGETPSLIRQTAAEAISVANTIKNTQNAKIYSVGVEAKANPAAEFNTALDGVATDNRGAFQSYDFNRFLHAVSSNYPDAKAMNNLGAGDKAAGYYMAASDTSNLGNIFSSILLSTVYELKTFDKATLSYTLTSDFTLTFEQEITLRNQLKEQYGLSDADITVVRNDDGTTFLSFRNIPSKEEYDAETGMKRYVASVSFFATANKDAKGNTATGTENSGAAYEGAAKVGFDTLPTVDVPLKRSLAVFTINGQAYRIMEASENQTFSRLETDLAVWDGTMQMSGNYSVFEAAEVMNAYAIHWIINGEDTILSYEAGEEIDAEAPTKEAEKSAPEGYAFSGWSPAPPKAMPVYSLACYATYAPEHEHIWVEQYKTGSCEEGVTVHYSCICGQEKDVVHAHEAHDFVAVISNGGYFGNTVEKLVCTKCGLSKEQNVTYRVQTSAGGRTQVLDLNLYQAEVAISEPDSDIQMRFYIGDTDKTYRVTRIDENGAVKTYSVEAKDGYLVFYLDHFSIYTLGELEGEESAETLSYNECLELLNSGDDSDYKIQAELNGRTLSYTVSKAVGASDTEASLVLAEYAENGRLLSAKIIPATWNNYTFGGTATISDVTASCKLFIIDKNTSPLGKAWGEM